MKRTLLHLLMVAAATAVPVMAQEGRAPAAPSARHAATGAESAGRAAIERAAAARKFVFLLFWKEKNPQTDQLWRTLQAGAAHMAQWADSAAVHVADPAEQELVTRYDLNRSPLPLVLAIAPCGAITKAFTGELTAEQLQTAYVSPGTQLSLKALQDRKLVLLCIVDQADPRIGAAVPAGARDFKADAAYGQATEIVLINARDQREASFLEELQVSPRMSKPCTFLLAPPGSVIGQFDGRATKEQMISRLVAARDNPCADGKCGPNGCGPKK